MSETSDKPVAPEARFFTPDMLYSVALFVAACVTLALLLRQAGPFAFQAPGISLFFLLFSLFTITVGFPHPRFGHVSFDRVGQVSAILVLGATDAALVCGAASLIYPWKRLAEGVPLKLVVMASLHNAGLMTLVVLGGGLLFTAIGGPVPLATLTLETAGYLLVLVFSMQLLNDAGMLIIFRLRAQDPGKLLTLFTTAVEIVSALMAILVAVVFTRNQAGVTILLLTVLAIGMLILKRYADMRLHLEALVDARTEELRLKTLELERQATEDKLTGLYNRRYADEYLERQLELSRRSGQPLTVALADIDHFKRINDRYSHIVGDRVLERVAQVLKARCRQSDVVARYGGEEFLLCFPDTGKEFAEQLCGELRQAIAAVDWHEVVGVAVPPGSLTITMSFGIAAAREDFSVTGLLDHADVRLYRAKNAGRNRVVA